MSRGSGPGPVGAVRGAGGGSERCEGRAGVGEGGGCMGDLVDASLTVDAEIGVVEVVALLIGDVELEGVRFVGVTGIAEVLAVRREGEADVVVRVEVGVVDFVVPRATPRETERAGLEEVPLVDGTDRPRLSKILIPTRRAPIFSVRPKQLTL